VFLHPVGSVGTIVHSGASGHKTSKHFFSCSSGTAMDSTKSVLGHVTPNLCFCIRWDLRLIVYSNASMARNINALFFMLGWDWCGLNNKAHRDTLR
jgi:hypothetical protein